jgi:hypothetical protein
MKASVNLKTKKWVGKTPEKCDLCGKPVGETFIDGKTHKGFWANMCFGCHTLHGIGIGEGIGKMYNTLTGVLLHG